MNKYLKNIIKSIWRFPLRTYYKHKVTNKNIMILSSNCSGGTLLHDACMPFLSPTVNLIIDDMDFIKLVKDTAYYLNLEPQFYEVSKWGFPVAKLGDILIHCVHYESFEEFKEIWLRRAKRFLEHSDYEVLVMATDSQIKTDEAFEEFEKLPNRKVLFTSSKNKSGGYVLCVYPRIC